MGSSSESAGEAGRIRIGATLVSGVLLLWRNLRSFAELALVVVAPLVIGTELLSRVEARGSVKAGLVIAVLTMSVLGESFCAGLTEHMVRHQQLGHPRQAWWRIAREVPVMRLAAVSTLVGTLVLLGLVFLVVPGLVVFAWLAMATPLVSIERTHVWAALRGSVVLVRGHVRAVSVLTTASLVPAFAADSLSSELEDAHAPLWAQLAVEVVTDVLTVAVSAAVIVATFDALRRAKATPKPPGSAHPV